MEAKMAILLTLCKIRFYMEQNNDKFIKSIGNVDLSSPMDTMVWLVFLRVMDDFYGRLIRR